MKLVKFIVTMRRSSDLQGIFVVNEEEWDILLAVSGQTIYLGEVSGKHSDVTFDFDISDLEILSEDDKEIEVVQRLVGDSAGFNFKYYLIDGFLDKLQEEAAEDCENDSSDEYMNECIEDKELVGFLREKYIEYWGYQKSFSGDTE